MVKAKRDKSLKPWNKFAIAFRTEFNEVRNSISLQNSVLK